MLRFWIVSQNLDVTVCVRRFRPSILPSLGMSFLYQALDPTLIGGIVRDFLNEMAGYKREMNQTHWAILATSVVVFGFMCLKGSGIKR
ncbi:hypothetical protein SV7mr_23820 [Stieleria bergensis]|uniref:Uncharacterized protein n=2 Tax=Stieleria bergensis TaxID=2528025 RepID=A0A517SUS1_9BACT|nr:hypothetical protein SV7mr_23820 [Planctomycetes bacterium SV_7m_r]